MNMSLPQAVIEYLNNSAANNGADQPGPSDDLFVSGTLDSFALIDFVTILEENCGVRVPDNEVIPGHFSTIEAIERYVASK